MKDAYYFSHDANARHDLKCQMLTSRFGMEGYGVFWVVVETLREHDDYRIPIRFTDAIDMDCKCNAKAIIDYCIEIGLFVSDGEYFHAPALLKKMKHLDEIRAKRAKAAGERWKKTKVKNSKVKESKVKGMHSKCNANAMQMDADFNAWWARYSSPHKTESAKPKCFKIWCTLTSDEMGMAALKVNSFIASHSEPRYVPKPSRYLEEKLWTGDFSVKTGPVIGSKYANIGDRK
jgi:hypothetical protein